MRVSKFILCDKLYVGVLLLIRLVVLFVGFFKLIFFFQRE